MGKLNEFMSFWIETKHKAAKNHRCIYCDTRILKGELYIRSAGIWEGDFQDLKWHPECLTDHLKTCDPQYPEIFPGEYPRPFVNSGLNI